MSRTGQVVAMTQLRTCQSSGPFTPDIPRHVSERLSVKCQQPNRHITNGTGAIVTIRSDRLDAVRERAVPLKARRRLLRCYRQTYRGQAVGFWRMNVSARSTAISRSQAQAVTQHDAETRFMFSSGMW